MSTIEAGSVDIKLFLRGLINILNAIQCSNLIIAKSKKPPENQIWEANYFIPFRTARNVFNCLNCFLT